MPADLHTHSDASSDSNLSLPERVSLAREHGITSVGCTDHTAVHQYLESRETVKDGVCLIAGVELNCTVGEVRIDVLGHFVDPHALREIVGSRTYEGSLTVDDGPDLDPADVIDIIHDVGGVATLAHPGRYPIDLEDLVADLVDAGLDGIETTYAYDLAPVAGPLTPEETIDALATAYDLLPAGGSDCHGPAYHDGPFMGAVTLPDDVVAGLRDRSRAYR